MLKSVFIALAIAALGTLPAAADDVANFYSGKRITIVVGYGTGGAYDLYARLLSRYMGRYLPGNPTFVVENMPGAGSLRAVNYLYSVAPKDGTVIGIFARPMALMSVLGGIRNMQFDASQFTWLGSASDYNEDAYLFFIRPNSPIRTVEEARRKDSPPILVGETATGASDVPILSRDELGMNLKIISGYQDANELYLAVERNEVEARATDYSGVRSGRPDWLKKNGGMRVLVQFGRATRHPDFPDVPTARELAPDAKTRQIIELSELPYRMSRPFAAPPGVPSAIGKALQNAFLAAFRDPQLIAEAEKMGLGVTPVSGDEVAGIIDQMQKTPPEARDALRRLENETD